MDTAHVTVSMVFIQEHDKLIKENQELKIQVGNLTGQRDQLKLILLEKDKTIEELKKENEELKSRILILEKKIEEQAVKIEEQAVKIDNLCDENKRRYHQQLLKAFLIALQGVNEFKKVENGSDEPYKTYMKNIRRSRNESSHYIDINDSDDLNQYKCRYLLTKLKQLREIEPLLNKRAKCHVFTDKMIEFLESIPTTYTPTEEEKEDVEDWWDDHL
jgi:chromosome segregation ATPase